MQEFDVYSAKRTGTGAWSTNRKITDAKSRSDYVFLGDYYDITIAGGGGPFVYGVWTDRRDEPTEFDYDDDVWGPGMARGHARRRRRPRPVGAGRPPVWALGAW